MTEQRKTASSTSSPEQDKNSNIKMQLLTRAMKDEAFRQELLTNPKTLIEHELGSPLPPGVTIQVHEDTPTTVHIVLPRWQLPTVEVPDADLEAAAAAYTDYESTIYCTTACTGCAWEPGC